MDCKEELRIYDNFNGMRFTFANGINVSLIWGGGTYSDNHHQAIESIKNPTPVSSSTVEVSVFHFPDAPEGDGHYVTREASALANLDDLGDGDGMINGWVPVSKIPDLLAAARDFDMATAKAMIALRGESQDE